MCSEVPKGTCGRETACVVLGTKMVIFGGSTNHMQYDEVTNAVCWFDTATRSFGHPFVAGPLPEARVSAEAVRVGSDMYVLGGWTAKGLIGDVSVLNLNCWDTAIKPAACPPPTVGVISAQDLPRPRKECLVRRTAKRLFFSSKKVA